MQRHLIGTFFHANQNYARRHRQTIELNEIGVGGGGGVAWVESQIYNSYFSGFNQGLLNWFY